MTPTSPRAAPAECRFVAADWRVTTRVMGGAEIKRGWLSASNPPYDMHPIAKVSPCGSTFPVGFLKGRSESPLEIK